jgi:hypothetical protein
MEALGEGGLSAVAGALDMFRKEALLRFLNICVLLYA